jgi:hypothetical protein
MLSELGPLSLTTPIPEYPIGVDIATMVSDVSKPIINQYA